MKISSVSGFSGNPAAMPTVSNINLSSLASIRVLDITLDSFEDAADVLLKSMLSSITGLGQNIDVMA